MTTTISGTSGVTYPNGGVDNTTGAGVGTTDTFDAGSVNILYE